MIAITAKVLCASKVESHKGDPANSTHALLSFGPDYADDRNKAWAEATPHLALNMTVTAEVAAHFETGKRYTLQFVEDPDA